MTIEMKTGKGMTEVAAARLLNRSWWILGLRGLLAIVLGIVALTRPAMTMSLLLGILSVYLLCDGVVTLFSAVNAASRRYTFWPYLVEGLVSVAVGILGLVRPGTIAMMLLVLVAARALIVGVIEIGTGLSARRVNSTAMFLLGLAGVASVAFGLLLLGRPSVGVFALAWSFGIYAIAFGLLLDVQALRGRRTTHRLERQAV